MKVGLFGGSFDPIHRGHLEPVRHAQEVLGLDQVFYLPTARPPHKEKLTVSAEARYTMVELALLGDAKFFVSPFEMRREICYTVESVEHFHNRMPGSDLVLILGADSWLAFTGWRSWRRIIEIAALAVLVRPGFPDEDLLPPFDALKEEGQLCFITNEPDPISSTQLRQRLQHGEEISADDVPPLVLDYIKKYRLYRSL